MGRYKDYDRGPKRGVDDDDQKSGDRASGVRPNYPRPSASAERRPATASQVVGSTSESIGTVKMYKADKGFGFVDQDDGGKDVFVHATALARAGLSGLAEGQRVRMQIGQGQKGLEARSIDSWTERSLRVADYAPRFRDFLGDKIDHPFQGDIR